MKLQDLTGQKFGRLTVLSRDGLASNGQVRWLCQCECSKTKTVLGGSLKSGNTKSCGCSTGRYVEEIPGTRYGRLVVLARGDNKYSADGTPRGATWTCRCDCGNEVAVTGHSLRTGNTESCGCLRVDRAFEKTSLPNGVAAKNKAIRNMKSNAERRNIPWELEDDHVVALTQQNCHYCGIPPMHTSKARNGDFSYNGLDRVDSGRGYSSDNVVPCCIVCNNAKQTLSLSEFLDWVERVYQYSIVPKDNKEG